MTKEEAIAKAMEWLEAGKDFVAEQAPELVTETLAWGMWSYSMGLLIAVGILAATAGGSRWTLRAYKRAEVRKNGGYVDETAYQGAALAIGLIGGVIGGVAFFINLFGLVAVIVAPRLYVLSQLSSLR